MGVEDGVSKVIKYVCNGLEEGFNGGARIVFDFSKTNGLMHLLERKGTIVIQKVVLTYRLINTQAFIYAVSYGTPQKIGWGSLLFSIYSNYIRNFNLIERL